MRAAQLRASEQREVLRVTLASIGDAVITTDTEGRVTYLNAVAESLTGWTRRTRPGSRLTPCSGSSTKTPGSPSRARPPGRSGKAWSSAWPITPADRRKTAASGRSTTAPRPSGTSADTVSGCVLIFRDVTAQRRVAAGAGGQLLDARRLASIVESSDDAIISKSLDGIIQSWNAAAEQLFGYTAAEAVGRHISLVIPPDRIAEEDHIIASLKAGRRIEHFETERMRLGRRSASCVSLTISPIKDDGGARGRRVQDRARRHPAAAGRAARAAAARRSGGCQRQVSGVLRAGRALCRNHGRGRHDPRGEPAVVGRLRLQPGADHRQAVLGRAVVGAVGRRWSQQIKAASAAGGRGADVPRRVAVFRCRRQPARGRRHHPADQGRERAGAVPGADGHRHHRP